MYHHVTRQRDSILLESVEHLFFASSILCGFNPIKSSPYSPPPQKKKYRWRGEKFFITPITSIKKKNYVQRISPPHPPIIFTFRRLALLLNANSLKERKKKRQQLRKYYEITADVFAYCFRLVSCVWFLNFHWNRSAVIDVRPCMNFRWKKNI